MYCLRSKKKDEETKEREDMKKCQRINKSYKRKWDKDMKKNERKAKVDEDIKKSRSVNKGNSSKESNEDYITKMPNEILLKIFSTLSMEDLIMIQIASPKLQGAAQDSCLWKDFKVNLKWIDPFKLKFMPAIRNIEGYTTNSAIKAILDNVIDLRKLDCTFYPDVSGSQMEQIVNKYKKLESVAVNICSPSGLECLEVLKSIKSLRKIKLCFCDDHDCYDKHDRLCSFKTPELRYTFFGHVNFPSLENMEVKYYLEDKQIPDDLGDVSCLAEIIKSKSQQLKYLNISAEIDATILEAVNQCTNLEKLNIQVFANRRFTRYGIDRLTKLRKLDLSIVTDDSNSTVEQGGLCIFTLLTKLNKSIKQGSWSYLTSVKFIAKRRFESNFFALLNTMGDRYHPDLLKSIIDNMKALKNLYFEYYSTVITEEQLLNIGDLESLESFRLYGVDVSNRGMSYLSNCHNLRILELDLYPSPKDYSHVATMLYPMEKLEFLSLRQQSRSIHIQSQKKIRQWISPFLRTVM